MIADPTTIAAIASSPEVDYVEVDAKVYATYLKEDVKKAALVDRTQSAKRAIVSQTSAPWGLCKFYFAILFLNGNDSTFSCAKSTDPRI